MTDLNNNFQSFLEYFNNYCNEFVLDVEKEKLILKHSKIQSIVV